MGLTGGFGQIRIGKLDTHFCLGSDEHGARATALQASSCALLGYVGSVTAQASVIGRSVNAVRYDLPGSMMTGLTGSFTYSFNPTGNDGAIGTASDGRAMSAALGYAAGPLALGVSVWNNRSEDRNLAVARANQQAWTLTGNWNFGFAKVGLTYDNSAIDNAAAGAATFVESERTAWSVPVTIGLGAGTVLMTYTRASNVKVGGANAAGTGARIWSVGYDHALSKRTSVGVSYANLNNSAAASYQLYIAGGLQNLPAPVAGQDQRSFYVGFKHSF